MGYDSDEAIVKDGIYEGDAGLWEVVWRLRHSYPSRSDRELTDIARREIEELLDAGLIELTRHKQFDETRRPIPLPESKRLIADDESWRRPEDRESIVTTVAFTLAGKEASKAW